MKDKLTVLIIADESFQASCTPAWECIESAFSFTRNVILCDLGINKDLMSVINNYRDIKRDFNISFFESINDLLHSFNGDTDWVMMLFIDEVVNEHSSHYLWDLVNRHSMDFSGALIPICNTLLSSEERDKRNFLYQDIRMVRKRLMRKLIWSGSTFEGALLNVAPATLCPRPICKLSTDSLKPIKNLDESHCSDDFFNDLPKSIKRLEDRISYSKPFV